jgi:hypothetical protein
MAMTSTPLTRRNLLSAGLATGALVVLGCSGASQSKPAPRPRLVMYKDPNCGCCGKWGEAAKRAGFIVAVADTSDMMAIKAKHGVPEALYSCHTSLVGGYVVEGHVPLAAVKRLLATRPKLKGIAVPGMPIGAPGMEVPGRKADPIEVLGFDAAGKVRRFA